MVLRDRPVGDQIDGTKGLFPGQRDPLQAAPLPRLQPQVVQRAPPAIPRMKAQVAFEANVPMPAIPLGLVLQTDPTELAVAQELDPQAPAARQVRMHPFQQLDLLLGATAARREHLPG
jgi:hypothetical protein